MSATAAVHKSSFMSIHAEIACDKNADGQTDRRLFSFIAVVDRLGQAKLIASFPFQHFQNIMRVGGHYSLFIIYIESSIAAQNYKSVKDMFFSMSLN